VAQVEANVAAADGPTLGPTQQQALREAIRQLADTSHR
jgi:hypothetical protein